MEFRGFRKVQKARETPIVPLSLFVYLIVIAMLEQHDSRTAVSSISMPQSTIMISFTYLFLPPNSVWKPSKTETVY